MEKVKLLKGNSPDIVSANVTKLKEAGYSHNHATHFALRHASKRSAKAAKRAAKAVSKKKASSDMRIVSDESYSEQVMPDLGAALITAMLKGGIAQYPDKRLYNAAVRLAPEDRPTVPVRLFSDPKPIYNKFGLPPNNADGLVGPDKDTIYISKKRPSYKDRDTLAALMAHEQAHITGADEDGARLKEYDTLKGLVGHGLNDRLDTLRDQLPSILARRKEHQ